MNNILIYLWNKEILKLFLVLCKTDFENSSERKENTN